MFSRKDSLPSPSLEDSFFPLSSTSSHSLSLNYPSSSSSSCCQGGSGSMGKAGLKAELEEGLETDLILAAELGQALLERNEELAEALIQRDRHVEVLQQEKHVLRRRLEVCELSSQQREAELTSELSSLLAELDRHHSRGQGQKREENTQLTELANHNHRLVEELAEAVSVEHSLRVELRSLREEMEDSSLSKTISSTQLDNTQAENRVLKERLGNMEEQLRLWQEDCDRLRGERERQRERLTDLQTNLREREAQLEQEQSVVFELRTLSRSLERRVQRLEEDTSLDDTHTYTHPLSLLSEIQQTQATETLLAHSTILQDKDQEIDTLREKLCSREAELDSLREELQPFRSCQGKPSYSSLESEVCTVRAERDSLTQQLLNTIQHKVVLSQEVDAWQEDMRLLISQQVQQQAEEKEREKEQEKESKRMGLQRTRSMRVRGERGKGGFFSSLFKGDE
ncbi:BICD family-like cargo adapter 2 isoform X2 [Oncorhynchus kisutch]|uniref:BICD family-like cargo adapter 2 n=1 Tax=Oncorhynchus kisutch TaxID=8019 RepID=A0A8C7I6F0_ONCKI|nr:BICD family-like cargo adapter 2 isoform X2 [Oncorhynchus kisutch]XP_031665458.1 BICD family-like cargo adapter 2 isoform X2 [Oncorhynchus kisutch]